VDINTTLGSFLRRAYAADEAPLPSAFRLLLAKLEARPPRPGDTLDEQRFKRELTALVPALRSFAKSLSRDSTAADDLAQETVLKAWAARDRFQPDTNLRSWTFTILRNLFFSQMRRQKFMGEWDERVAEARLVSRPEQENRLHLEDVDRMLARLPAKQRRALLLVEAEDMSYEEVADAIGVPVGTVKSRVCRARKALIEAAKGSEMIAA
jgi:RNA polymerase sigma-70 factor (ECF subfamily)